MDGGLGRQKPSLQMSSFLPPTSVHPEHDVTGINIPWVTWGHCPGRVSSQTPASPARGAGKARLCASPALTEHLCSPTLCPAQSQTPCPAPGSRIHSLPVKPSPVPSPRDQRCVLAVCRSCQLALGVPGPAKITFWLPWGAPVGAAPRADGSGDTQHSQQPWQAPCPQHTSREVALPKDPALLGDTPCQPGVTNLGWERGWAVQKCQL